MGKTFVSYAKSDASFALRLVERLKAEGIELWIDQLAIPAGARWDEEIEQALQAAHILLLILSPRSVESQNVLDEVSYALDHNLTIVPVLVTPANIPLRLRRLQYIDFTVDFEAPLQRCLAELKARIANKAIYAHPPSTVDGLSSQQKQLSGVVWPRSNRIRVSMAALVKIERNRKYLLVRNMHRPQTFSPLGGVFKYFPRMTTLLHDIGFEPELRQGLEDDLALDLRGFLPAVNFPAFIDWFHTKRGRELPEACLRRELREKLLEAHIFPPVNTDGLTFELVRTAEEKASFENAGFDQYRYIEVYEPSIDDFTTGTQNLEIIEQLFAALPSVMMAAETRESLLEGKISTGDHIASTVAYFYSNKIRKIDLPMQGENINSEAINLLRAFIKSDNSTLLKNASHCTDPVLLHRIQKGDLTSYVASLYIDSTPAILKYYTGISTHFDKEVWALSELRDTVSMPKLLDWGKKEGGSAFIIIEKIQGRPLSEFDYKTQIQKLPEIVREILGFRKFTQKAYGEIIGEYGPVSNQQDLSGYVNSMTNHWLYQLRALSESDRAHGLDQILIWAERVAKGDEGVRVWSALAEAPCICHSDIKPQDVFLVEGQDRPVLIDFDNIFSFIPEFDLCKLHFGLISSGAKLDLEEYALIIGSEAGTNILLDDIHESLLSVYPYVCARLLNWAIPRKAQATIDRVAAVLKKVSMQKQLN